MNDNKPTHKVLLAESFMADGGEEKTHFTDIGSAWMKETGTISCELRTGIAVSGRFIVVPRKEDTPIGMTDRGE